jgi:prolyl 4-hydroxylase
MKKIDYNHEIFVIEDFLTKEECEDLILTSENIGFEEAKVQTGENAQSILKGVRNNDRILYENEILATKLFEKAKPFLTEDFASHKMIGLNEMFRFYK